MNDLTGKVALVTGSSRGIGREIALKLAARGAKVIFHGVTISEKLRSAVQAAGDPAEMITADFSDPAAVKKMADEIKQRDLSPDILVLNASVQSYTGLHNFSCEEFQLMFRTNVESCCILLHEFIPQMRKKAVRQSYFYRQYQWGQTGFAIGRLRCCQSRIDEYSAYCCQRKCRLQYCRQYDPAGRNRN